jgi:hypothetical protein
MSSACNPEGQFAIESGVGLARQATAVRGVYSRGRFSRVSSAGAAGCTCQDIRRKVALWIAHVPPAPPARPSRSHATGRYFVAPTAWRSRGANIHGNAAIHTLQSVM